MGKCFHNHNRKWAGLRRGILALSMVLLCSMAVPSAHAASVSADTQQLNLGPHVRYLETQDSKAGVSTAVAWDRAGKFQASEVAVPAYGFSQSIWWFAVDLNWADSSQAEWLLEIAYSMLDHVEVFFIRDSQVLSQWEVGDSFAFKERVFEHRHFILPFEVHETGSSQFYIRVETSGAVQLPLTLWRPDAFAVAEQPKTLGEGFYFGIMMVMLLYNFCLWFWTGQRSYAFYTFYVFTVALFVAGLRGLCFQYLWPEALWWHSKSVAVFTFLMAIGICGFSASFLRARKYDPTLFRLLVMSATVGVVGAVTSLSMPYSISIRMAMALNAVCVAVCFWGGVRSALRGFRPARVFLGAYGLVLTSGLIVACNKAGIIERTFLTEYALMIGTAIEVVLFSLALGDRLNSLESQRRDADASLEESYRKLGDEQAARLQIFSSVAHELNNPMNYISLAADQLLKNSGELRRQVDALFTNADENENMRKIRSGFHEVFAKQESLFTSLSTGVDRSSEVIRYMRGLGKVDGEVWEKISASELVGQAQKRLMAGLGASALSRAELEWEFGECGQMEVVGNPYVLVHGLCLVLKEAIRSSLHTSIGIFLEPIPDKENGVRCEVVFHPDDAALEEIASLEVRQGSRADVGGTTLRTARAVFRDQGADLWRTDHPDPMLRILVMSFPGETQGRGGSAIVRA